MHGAAVTEHEVGTDAPPMRVTAAPSADAFAATFPAPPTRSATRSDGDLRRWRVRRNARDGALEVAIEDDIADDDDVRAFQTGSEITHNGGSVQRRSYPSAAAC